MRIDPATLLFHDLSDEEAAELRQYGEDIMLRGDISPITPAAVQEWLQYIGEGQFLLVVSTVLPGRIFYSLLLRGE